MGEILIAAILVFGGLFGLIGSFALLKLDSTMKRLHAPTKATTIGVGTALVASVLHSVVILDTPSWHEVLVIVFLFVTAPVTAHFLSKAHIHRVLGPADLPPTGTGQDWATFDTDVGASGPAETKPAEAAAGAGPGNAPGT